MLQFPRACPPALLVSTDQTLPLENKYFLPQGGAGALPSLNLCRALRKGHGRNRNDPKSHRLSVQNSVTLGRSPWLWL